MKLPSRLWEMLGRRMDEFEGERCSGSITVELHFDHGRLASWKMNPVYSERVDEKPLTPVVKQA